MPEERQTEPMTYEAIGEVLGLSHTYVRMIELAALRKARGIAERLGYKVEDLLDTKRKAG